jgi:serine/threonine-protein kinase
MSRWKQEILHSAAEAGNTGRVLYFQRTFENSTDLGAEVESLLEQDSGTDETALQTVMGLETGCNPIDQNSDLVGNRIGAYRITGLIGKGGMAEVYRAVRADDQYKKIVAIKLLRLNKSTSFFVSRFCHERQILANLEHSYIARFLEGGTTEDGVPYFVMEYIEGIPITDYCKKYDLPIRKRLELFCQVCEVVQFAHRNLVIHRDLKPSNILVTPEGTPKLLDFGIAKLLNTEAASDSPTGTITSLRLMTPEYASPEQVRGETVTTATDVYSLGSLLYELLTNQRVHQFKSKTIVEFERVICRQDPERPSSVVTRVQGTKQIGNISAKKLGRELARELDSIILKAMEKNPLDRYHTAAQFLDDIRRYMQGIPIRAKTQTLGYRAMKFTQRHRTAVIFAATIFALLGGLALVTTLQASQIAKERDRAKETTDFLVNLFEVADPGETRGNQVTAEELLKSGTRKIQSDLKEQPEVQASMLNTIGRVYIKLGLYDEAIPVLEKSLELRKQAYGDKNLEVASTMKTLASALQNAGQYDTAKKLITKALAIQRSVLGNRHAEVAGSLTILGDTLYEIGKYDEAEAAYREALKINSKVLGEETLDVAISLGNVADVLLIQGKTKEAEELHQKALEMQRKLSRNNHLHGSTMGLQN